MTTFVRGQTGIVVLVPAAEPVVGSARASYDPATAYDVPAHVTVLFPFLPFDEVDEEVRAEVARICSSVPEFDVTFPGTARWPGISWLEPDPAAPFRELTRRVAERWLDHPPYEGAHDEPTPHLTLAQGDDERLAAAERLVRPGLPFGCRVDRVDLVAFDGSRWTPAAHWALGGQASMLDMSP